MVYCYSCLTWLLAISIHLLLYFIIKCNRKYFYIHCDITKVSGNYWGLVMATL